MPLTLTLPLRNEATLTDFLRRLYDKTDPLYGQYLTPEQFAARFSPTQADYDRVVAFAQAQGLTVTGTSPSRTTLNVSGTAAQVQRAFGVSLNLYQAQADGRYFYAPGADPVIPATLAGVVTGVVGLNNAAVRYPHVRILSAPNPFSPSPLLSNYLLPLQTGSGLGGGLTPSDIKTAYGLNGVSRNGTGQTLALFELDGYAASDITTYEDAFSLPHVPLQNVRVDGYNGVPSGTNGQVEVTLDIQLQIALAPGASKVIVYEAPNTDRGVVDLYARIASDNLAKSVSTSWGPAENSSVASTRNSENTSFRQMAAQGQSIFAASGDSGAYDDGQSLSVDDHASQPFMTGVGGTALAANSPGGPYGSETTWNGGSINGGGGGGISTVWPQQGAGYNYQVGVTGSVASGGSTTMRNVPDVSLAADPRTGYLIYFGGRPGIVGGTSCAAPLWSAFAALVNQQRVAYGLSYLGFANPALYNVARGSRYAVDFHDIANGSTNLFYPTVTGYDNATGLGSFNGVNLLADLAPLVPPFAPQTLRARNANARIGLTWTVGAGAPTTSYNLYRGTTSGGETLYRSGLSATNFTDTAVVVGTSYYYQVSAANSSGEGPRSNEAIGTAETATQILTNAGFENGLASPAPWVTSTGVIDNSTSEAPHAGAWKAWLDGYGSTHTDTLALQTTIPATMNVGTLTFFLHVDTAERSRTTDYDSLQVQVRDLSGKVLGIAGTFTNRDAAPGFVSETVDLSPYLGQAAQVVLVGKEDSSFQTSFVVDDFTLSVQ